MHFDRMWAMVVVWLFASAAGCKKSDTPPNTTSATTTPVPAEAQAPENEAATATPEVLPVPATGAQPGAEPVARPEVAARPVEDFAARVEKEITPENYKQALGDVEKAILKLETRIEGSGTEGEGDEPPGDDNEAALPEQEPPAPDR